jgi:signal transduction histidine kinase
LKPMQTGAISAATKTDAAGVAAAGRVTSGIVRCAFLGMANAELGQLLAREIQRFSPSGTVQLVSHLAQLRECLAAPLREPMRESTIRNVPRAILLDEALLEGAPLVESLRQLTEAAPVILLASLARSGEVGGMVAEGDVEFVARAGDFIPVAASLVERRLRWAERSESALGPPWAGLPADTAEIFRHEINNPLTGILGNAELLLAHRDRLPVADSQRLETVVSLAVRLRETIRRLSNAWETQPPSLKSA